MNEIWRDIEGYEGLYQVSDSGNVKSFPRLLGKNGGSAIDASPRILKKRLKKRGYLGVVLYKNKKQSPRVIHRLVAQAFIPNPENKSQVNHIDECTSNNNLSNLEWATPRENVNYSVNKRSSSQYSGVSIHKITGKWQANCVMNKKIKYLGLFVNEEDAAQAYICFCAIHNLK